MALLKENYLNQSGVPEQYWKITNINVNMLHSICDITLAGYCNQQTRVSELQPISTQKIRCHWGQEHFAKHFSAPALAEKGLYEQAYEFCKTHEFFENAKDI